MLYQSVSALWLSCAELNKSFDVRKYESKTLFQQSSTSHPRPSFQHWRLEYLKILVITCSICIHLISWMSVTSLGSTSKSACFFQRINATSHPIRYLPDNNISHQLSNHGGCALYLAFCTVRPIALCSKPLIYIACWSYICIYEEFVSTCGTLLTSFLKWYINLFSQRPRKSYTYSFNNQQL